MRDSIQHRPLTPDICDHIRLLRDNCLDLSIALDDLDAELAPRFAERARLEELLDDAENELAALLRRAA